jgi:GYF domain 2
MAAEWYVHDLAGQHGPFGPAELRQRFQSYTDTKDVFVWREGFQQWKPVAEAFDLDQVLQPTSSGIIENQPSGSVPAHRFNNFVARNWRGEFSLGVTYWLFGFAGNVAVALIPLVLASLHPSRSGVHPTYIFSMLVGTWIIIVTISIWQWVAVWRSSKKFVRRRALEQRKAPWARVAQVMTVIAFVQLGAAMLSQGVPQITEITRIAFMGDPDIPEYTIRVMRNGTEAEITGGIRFGLAADFTRILRASRQIRVVHLNSIGGRIAEGEQLYKVILDNNLTTFVAAKCLSACTMAFAAGRERVLLHRAVLGFHRGSFAGEDFRDSPELAGQRRIFTAAGYSPQFIDRALATPSAEMWKPSEAELLSAGVITRVSTGADYAYSGFPPDITKAYFSTALAKSADIYAAIRDRDPARYDEMVDSYYQAVIDGKTTAETIDRIAGLANAVISPLRKSAADDVLVDVANLYADQFEALQKQHPELCHQFARTGTFPGELPKALLDRELNLKARIVRTASAKFDSSAPSRELWIKLADRMYAGGVPKADIELTRATDIKDFQQPRYCAAMIAFYREIARLPQAESARIVRTMIASQ